MAAESSRGAESGDDVPRDPGRIPPRVHVMHGRFQPFHLGHLDYAVAAAHGCDILVVGLTRSLPELGVASDVEAQVAEHRFRDTDNPLSFGERAYVITQALAQNTGINCEVAVIPFPIERPDLFPTLVPRSWLMITTEHEPWNSEKIAILKKHGYEVRIVCQGDPKIFRGAEIREQMRTGDPDWKEAVPAGSVAALERLKVPQRLAAERAD